MIKINGQELDSTKPLHYAAQVGILAAVAIAAPVVAVASVIVCGVVSFCAAGCAVVNVLWAPIHFASVAYIKVRLWLVQRRLNAELARIARGGK